MKYKRIPLGNEKYAIVDSDDWERLSRYKWSLSSKGYAYRSYRMGQKTVTAFMHKDVAGLPPGVQGDHINRIKTDNRKSNIRAASNSQNQANRGKRVKDLSKYPVPTCPYKGVSYRSDGKRYCARIGYKGHVYHIASCDNAEDAATYYDVAAQIFFGEYAYTNRSIITGSLS